MEPPIVNERFGAVAVEPPAVLPQVIVLGVVILPIENPPVPLGVNPVSVAIANTVVALALSVIILLPKLIARVFVLSELNTPVVKLALSVNVPDVKVKVVAVKVELIVVIPVIDEQFTASIVFPLPLIVPVLTIVAVRFVYVPPDAKVKLYKFNVATAGVQVLPVKSSKL